MPDCSSVASRAADSLCCTPANQTDMAIMGRVHPLFRYIMNPVFRSLICGCLLFLIFVIPVAASPVLTSESFTPNPPLIPGDGQEVVATFAIPSGTTFPRDHEIQMTTQLENAKWNIQVVVDGHNSAQQTASGTAAFINGMVLSYSVNHDVRFTVTVTGTVPPAATGSVTVIDLIEIDNTGNIMSGSEIVVSQPAAGSPTAPAVITVPTRTPPLTTASPAATRSPAFSAVVGILASGMAGVVWMRRRH
ncbi:hypothetical protein Metfor_0575 [Methanoregula formicica SMSP]|uniref:Uncharacterized protein n=2 Tax=Methanoregula formicica TaxID=882104 RepID=L0HEA0_METFS|nr:hypothetical protein Metfor_0575 [Methanoregula formicica SMSP]